MRLPGFFWEMFCVLLQENTEYCSFMPVLLISKYLNSEVCSSNLDQVH